MRLRAPAAALVLQCLVRAGLCARFLKRRAPLPPARPADVIPRVICTEREIRALFRPGVRDGLRVMDESGASVPVRDVPAHCGVSEHRDRGGQLAFSSAVDGCFVNKEAGSLALALGVRLHSGERWYQVNITCPDTLTQPQGRGKDCSTQKSLRVPCGPPGAPPAACLKLGCCYSPPPERQCYYRLDDCSQDGQFIFAVRRTDADPPLDLSRVRVRGQSRSECLPVIMTSEAAVFKFGVMQCGAQREVYGQVFRYDVELEAEPAVSELEFGPVSRDTPFRVRVECQYSGAALVRTGLRALDPPLPPPASGLGSLRVEMRIATDSSFTSFYPPERLPLSLPLQEPLYVEVRVRDPPDPGVTLRIRDCFAYPASRHSLWVLLYNGCPNTLDSEFPSSVLEGPGAAGGDGAVQYRRFDIKTFTFIDPETGEPSQEEVYFYCWVEVCAADSERCQSQCVHNTTAGQSDSERLRRQLGSDPEARLVSVGPVRLGNGTAHRTPPPDSLRTGAVLEMLSVYSISAIGSASLFLLLSALAMGLLRRRAIRRSGVARESGAVATDTASETVATS